MDNGNVDAQVDANFTFSLTSICSSAEPADIGISLSSKRNDLYYCMDNSINGRCIILNYESFDAHDLSPRKGTKTDVRKLNSTFKMLNFDVQTYDDLTLQKTFEVLKQEASMDHSRYNCFVVCFLSHGSNGKLHTKDKIFEPNRMFECFSGNRCRTLVGKPKLFFIQACRGDSFDSGVLVHDSPNYPISSYFMLPNFSDFLIFYSTFPGYYSWRNVENGSWFIQTLCDVLNEYHKKYDLLTLMTIVCQKVAIDYESRVPQNPDMHRKKQMPCIMSTLTRLMTFN